eukprot:scaffold67206_cov28-Prasinocladus_malaysianus.AAC.1
MRVHDLYLSAREVDILESLPIRVPVKYVSETTCDEATRPAPGRAGLAVGQDCAAFKADTEPTFQSPTVTAALHRFHYHLTDYNQLANLNAINVNFWRDVRAGLLRLHPWPSSLLSPQLLAAE